MAKHAKRPMMTSTRREIANSSSRFFSILAIVAIGIGFFGGVKATGPDMRLSADTYYERQNLMDFRLASTYGFSEADIAALRALGNFTVLPSYFADVLADAGSGDEVARVYALEDDQSMNRLTVLEGRLPQAPGECVADGSGMRPVFHVGDTLQLSADGDADLSDTLAVSQYTVVGLVESPLYVSGSQHGSTTVGDGSIDTFLYVPQQDFTAEVYTQVFLTSDEFDGAEAYSDRYDETADRLKDVLEAEADVREPLRLEEVRREYTDKIADAQQQVDDGQKKIDDAKQQLADAAQKLADARQQLADSRKQLDDGWQAWRDGCVQLTDALQAADAEYQQGLAQYAAGKATLDGYLDTLAATLQSLGQPALQPMADALTALKDDSSTDAQLQQITALRAMTGQLDAMGLSALSAQITPVLDSCQQLVEGKQKLDLVPAQIAQANTDGSHATQEAYQKLVDGENEYSKGLSDYSKGQKEYLEKKTDAERDIADGEADLEEARQKIADAQKDLDDLKEPVWYVFDRDDNPGYAEYGQNADRINNIAKMFPVFFILVAALVCLTTMSRMVEEQRTQIGTLKALGYSDGAILSKYLIYAVSATLIGSILGLAGGYQLFPRVIIYSYGMMYRIPEVCAPFRVPLAAVSTAVAVACVVAVVWASCRSEFVQLPARLMRPKAPPSGKRILLEHIRFLWGRMNFSQKVSARNIFRYKKRMLMTIVGIAGCTALSVTGFALKDSISCIVKNQFDYIWTYQAMVAYDSDTAESDLDYLRGCVTHVEADAETLDVLQQNYTAKSAAGQADAVLFVPQQPELLGSFICLRDRRSGEKFTLDDSGAIISEKLATLLHLKVGDSITMSLAGEPDVQIPVRDITENYAYHYVYVSPSLYARLFGKQAQCNMMLCRYGAQDADTESRFSAAVLENSHVQQVSLLSGTVDGFRNLIKILDLVMVVLIVSAGALAFVVLYNLTNININERIREIATLKVLGFDNREVSAYIFRENIVLSIMGTLVGLGLGYLMAMQVIVTAEIDMVMFGRVIYAASYLWAALITMGFSLIVSLFMRRSLHAVSMVESLKSVE